jgi:hypothetical protein
MTNKIYDVYQFHDNLLHGISFLVENFQSELRLDIDHILQWPNCPSEADETLHFTVSKALLTFFDVTDLSVCVNWFLGGSWRPCTGSLPDRIAFCFWLGSNMGAKNSRLATYFSHFAPQLKASQYGREIWNLYLRGQLRPDTPLTGRIRYEKRPVNVAAVTHEIHWARLEAERLTG